MTKETRKAAIAAYRERKVVAGIFAVVCRPTGHRWAGIAADLSTIQNRLWFGLRLGSSPHRAVQAAWSAHGADAFGFEVVERLPEEADPYLRDRLLKARLDHWLSALPADRL